MPHLPGMVKQAVKECAVLAEKTETEFGARTSAPPRRGFALLWGAQTISQFGDAVYTVALPLIVYDATGSAGSMATIFGLSLLPHALAGLVGGVFIDRRGPRGMLIGSAAAAAAMTGLIALLVAASQVDMVILGIATVLLATAASLLMASFETAIPRLVEGPELVRANARLETSRVIAQTVGPICAGFLVAAGSGALATLANGVSFAMAALLVLPIQGLKQTPAATASATGADFRTQIRTALSVAWNNSVIRFGSLVACAANFFVAILEVYVIFVLRNTFGVSAGAVGMVFMAACLITMLTGAVLRRFEGRVALPFWMAISLAALAVTCALMALQTDLAVVVVALLINIWATVLFNTYWRALRQRACPPGVLGRVSGIVRGTSYAGGALGSWCGGLLTSTASGITGFFTFGALVLIVLAPVTCRALVGASEVGPSEAVASGTGASEQK
ncbi:hypothetical protein B1H19_35570 [Streptomyces gilvosporeus]|uniref:MFS transporter n=1 Tax=Streptomyces gilvosporeus TaxID=553510 RepID=A0A1V0U0Q9_9ACTN|nr:hypothetical protein B1H19_35570 [Streptomyces gilvosporeus]